MNKVYFPIHFWQVGAGILDATFEALRADGERGCEGIVFWVGSRVDGIGRVALAVLVDGPGVTKRPNFIRVSDQVIAKVTEMLDPPSRVLIGQVHTHWRGVAHSPTDNRYIFNSPGYLSIVIDQFAAVATPDPGSWGVHVGTGTGFRRLEIEESRTAIQVMQRGERSVEHVWA